MRTVKSSSPGGAFLADLAESLGHAIADNGGALLVHVVPAADGFEVGVASIDGLAPADALLGSVAPGEWCALGVATGGWARPLDNPRAANPARAETVVLVARDGEVVGRLRIGDRIVTDPPAWGLTLDGLQRALGLPTAPEARPPSALFAATWLERVLDEAAQASGWLDWGRIRALHPALEILGLDADADIVGAGAALARTCDWERLRWLVVEGSWREAAVTPSDAAWFDAGSFARWALDHHGPVGVLLDETRRILRPADARRCARVLHRLGLRSSGQAA